MPKRVVFTWIGLLLLSSCSLLKSAELANRRAFVRASIEQSQTEAYTHVPDSLPLPLSLYPTASHQGGNLEKAFEIAYSQAWRSEAVATAYLSQRYEVVLHFAEEHSMEYLNSLLRIGHPAEAHRLIASKRIDDPATLAMVHLAEGDTTEAVTLLTTLLQDKRPWLRRIAARHLVLLPNGRRQGLSALAQVSPSMDERRLAHLLLQIEDSPAQLSTLSSIVIRMSPSWLRELALLELRPLLLRAQLWPQLDDVHTALPAKYHADYPYCMLSDCGQELALIRAFVAQELPEPTPSTTRSETSATTFRERYGNVRNVNNWAMTYSSSAQASSVPILTNRPTQDEYHKALETIAHIFR